MQVSGCPQCGAPAAQSDKRCTFCKAPFVVNRLSSLSGFEKPQIDKYISAFRGAASADGSGEASLALGLCYLRLKIYPIAIKNFQAAVERMPENSDSYYYYALALLKGRKPRQISLGEAREIDQYLSAATELDATKAHYPFLMAIVKYDYYVRNGLRVNPPTVDELLAKGRSGVRDSAEIDLMLEHAQVGDPMLGMITG